MSWSGRANSAKPRRIPMRKMLTIAAVLAISTAAVLAQPACPGFPNCLYLPSQTYTVSRTVLNLTYTDITGRPRTIEVTVRMPNGRTGALPVVIWAHGGAEGRQSSVGALSTWSDVSATSGY